MSNRQISSFIVAAPRSNSGKTLITLGLIKALSDKGLKIQPFKCGPDYIDSMHHAQVAGNKSYNLDSWMSSTNHISEIYNSKCWGNDVAIVEGVMGLFDGAKRDVGSTAELARHLNIPVVLVVDASSMAYSVAPLLFGYKNFDKRLQYAGVIFNKVGSVNHYHFLKQAADDVGLTSLGYLLKDKNLHIESRHLGLHLPGKTSTPELVEKAAAQIEKNIDLEALLMFSKKDILHIANSNTPKTRKKFTVAIAHDEAFNFTYPANIDALNTMAKVKTFSPLSDPALPDCDLLWLPGGYPELFAKQLSSNKSMLQSIRMHIETEKATLAECGGMMYLGSTLVDKKGKPHEMSGIFSYSTSLKDGKLHLGYRKLKLDNTEIRGHEFHYSELSSTTNFIKYLIKNANDKEVDMPVFRYKNCWASYMHSYLGEPEKMKAFLEHLNINPYYSQDKISKAFMSSFQSVIHKRN